jgi:hypothetical protein
LAGLLSRKKAWFHRRERRARREKPWGEKKGALENLPSPPYKHHYLRLTNESIINQPYPTKISPNPSFSKRGIPPLTKGREGGI